MVFYGSGSGSSAPTASTAAGVEFANMKLGVTVDGNGDVTGIVYRKEVYDEENDSETSKIVRVATNGTITDPYTGSWVYNPPNVVNAPNTDDLTEVNAYVGTLTPGSYTLSDVLTLIGGGSTKLLAMSITVASGNAQFAQGGGSVSVLPAASIIQQEYRQGFNIPDFTITVDASSSVYIEASAI